MLEGTLTTAVLSLTMVFSSVLLADYKKTEDYAVVAEIMEIMKANVLTKSSVDWQLLQTEVDELFRTEQSDVLKKSIYRILEVTNTGHSFYSSSSHPRFVMHYTRECHPPQFEKTSVPNDIGYIEVSRYVSAADDDDADFVRYIRHQINTQSKRDIKGWIVDLSDNTGGNMWPMLSGVAPLLGDGVHGYFGHSDGSKSSWSTKNGSGFINDQLMIEFSDDTAINTQLPIAVISSQITSSSGEAILLSFKGKKNVKTFGNDSCGMSTANKPFALSNGGTLIVTTSTMMDSFANPYGEAIEVDIETETPFKAATEWIRAF